jgi:O-antigen/teichoic acid export membrane protein
MSSKRLILKGGATLGAGQAISQACSFVRNIIIARLISPTNFGIAATFAVTISVFDLMSNLNMDKLLIQAEDGDEAAFEKTAHLLQTVKGVMNAAFIFVLGRYIAGLFGEPQARWAFELLALVPLLRGFNHLDTYRFQREMRFRPAVTMDVSSQVLVTVAALPLAFWLRDYRAMLWVLILQAATAAVVSHLVADRPYGWTWEKSYVRRIVSFGWPLLINGLLLFIILDGDRFIIGSAHKLFSHSTLTLADLGVYSVAFALTMGPVMLVTNVTGTVFFPLLSRSQGIREQFERRYSACAQFLAVVAAGIAIPFVLLGGWLVVLIYGAKYAAAEGFIAWLGAMWSLRLLRAAPTTAALSLGDSKNSMYSNIARTVALAGVLTAVAVGAGLVWIAVSGFAGELLALAVCVGRLRYTHGVPASSFVKPFAVYAALALAAGAGAWTMEGTSLLARMGLTVLLGAAACAIMLAAFPRFRADIEGLARSSRLFGGARETGQASV